MVSGLRFPMMKTLRKASIITGERICRICQIVDDYPHMEMLVFTMSGFNIHLIVLTGKPI